jgi:hypothetical protein
LDNLPFNALDYDDALKVLENRFKSNLLLSRADEINYISITYEVSKIDKPFLAKINLYMFGLILLILILIGFYEYILYNDQALNTLEITLDTAKYEPNKCLFGLFKVFDITNPSYIYYPNCNNPVKIISVQNFESFSMLDRIKLEQDKIFKDFCELVFKNFDRTPKVFL